MTRIELEKVADVFFPDRRALHLVDVSDIVAQLTRKHDWKKVENETDAVKIEREVWLVNVYLLTLLLHQYRYNVKLPSVLVPQDLKWSKLEKENIKYFVQNVKCCSLIYTLQFGDSQRPYLVRILRTTVMVRVGGGWITLTEFLQKHDPCRGKTVLIMPL